MPPVDASSTTTPNLWSTLPSTSVLASKRKETVLKAFSIVHHERGDARLGHGAEGSPRRVFRHCVAGLKLAILEDLQHMCMCMCMCHTVGACAILYVPYCKCHTYVSAKCHTVSACWVHV